MCVAKEIIIKEQNSLKQQQQQQRDLNLSNTTSITESTNIRKK